MSVGDILTADYKTTAKRPLNSAGLPFSPIKTLNGSFDWHAWFAGVHKGRIISTDGQSKRHNSLVDMAQDCTRSPRSSPNSCCLYITSR